MLPQATEHMQPPDTGWARNRFSFRASENAEACSPTNALTSEVWLPEMCYNVSVKSTCLW